MEYPQVKHLYKYYAYNENSLSVLINKKIWLAKPKSFSDPFDCDINFEDNIEDELLEQIFGGEKIDPKHSDEVKQTIIKGVEGLKERRFRNVGIFSMSENDDNILMWSHYAGQHKGFCVEFVRNSDNYLGNIEMTKPIDYPINYTKVKFFNPTGDVNKDIFQSVFYTKARDWVYEGEWRCVYREGDREVSMPSAISSIIFGLRMPRRHRDTIMNILSGQGVSYKEAVKADQFKIKIIDLTE